MPVKSPFFAKNWFDKPYRHYCAQRRRLLVYLTSYLQRESYVFIKVKNPTKIDKLLIFNINFRNCPLCLSTNWVNYCQPLAYDIFIFNNLL